MSAIDGAQENIVLGFSWKSDGIIPQEHPAYYMWQTLKDRRSEFELIPFNTTEVSHALTLFSKELGHPINPKLKRFLSDNCQGFPWLLKKLSIHVFKMVQEGKDQIDILGEDLSIKNLFDADLMLQNAELACVNKIAAESPAEFYQIENAFGADVVRALVNKRLVIRSCLNTNPLLGYFSRLCFDKKRAVYTGWLYPANRYPVL